MKTFKKSNLYQTQEEIVNDINKAFDVLFKENAKSKARFYHVVIKETKAKHDRDLSFMLTNKLFNRLNKETSCNLEVLNYIFVVEYSKVHSLGLRVSDDLGMHSHIAISSTLPKELIQFFIQSTFPKSNDIWFDDITKNENKEGLRGYFLKQTRNNHLFTSSSYNYKINLTN
jgi:hypothetical protein